MTQESLISNPQSPSFFTRYRFMLPITLVVIFALGLGIRLYDLTDPPLDFHATRQLRSLLMSRGLYLKWIDDPDIEDWQYQQAIAEWDEAEIIEPPIFEILTAITYRVVGQHDWIARIWSSLFWLIGRRLQFVLLALLVSFTTAII